MALFSAVSGLFFLSVCGVIAVQLLRLSLRTRQAPEFFFGAALALMVLLGCPFAIAGSIPGLLAPATASAFSVVSLWFVEAGVFCLWAFTWKVFRASERWAKAVVIVAGGLLILQVLGATDSGLPARSQQEYFEATRMWLMLHHFVLAGAFGWSAVESMIFGRALRKRLAIGLADRVVVDRISLWARMGIVTTAMNAINALCLMVGWNIMTHPVPQLSTAVLGLFAAVYLYLGFLPPDWYLQRINSRAIPA